MDSWYIPFEKYFTKKLKISNGLLSNNVSIEFIRSSLVQFLYSPSGGKYQYLFTFDQDMNCGKSLPQLQVNNNWKIFTKRQKFIIKLIPIQVTIMELKHKPFNSSKQGIQVMNAVKKILRNSSFQGRLFPFSQWYSVWEIDEVFNILE